MDEPGAWVVSFERNYYVATSWHQDNISAGRVVEFEIELGRVKCFVVCLFEDCEIVTVEMDL